MFQGYKNNRILIIYTSIIAFIGATCSISCAGHDTPGKPNIVVFLADDLGYGDVGCYGNTKIHTPVLDNLASEGVRFTSFYANAPECTPTRTALLTGRYQQRVGGLECAIGINNVGRYDDAIRLRETNDLGLPGSETSIIKLLKKNGYNTAIFGKWHLGYENKFSPMKHGFDENFYAIGGGMDYFHYTEPGDDAIYSLYQNEKMVKKEGYFTDLIGEESLQFIDKQSAEKPFILYVPFTAPHSPYQGPDDYAPQPLPKDSPLWNWGDAPKDVYAAMIEHMDKVMGDIINKIDEKGFGENTLVIVMSDNGASPSGSNLPFRGGKGNLFEGGIRVPCVVKWPGKVEAGSISDQTCMTLDFSSSILRAAGIEEPQDSKFDGMDIIKYVEEKKPAEERTLFWRARRKLWTRRAVRHGDLKYIRLMNGDDAEEFLFDLALDPGEKDNQFESRTDDVNRLKKMLVDWEMEVKAIR